MMIKQFFQLLRLKFIFIKYSLDELFYAQTKLTKFKILCWLNPYYLLRNRKLCRGTRLRLALQQAGPIFIKFGQMLSTRYDAIPEDILIELTKLRDRVTPVSGRKIIKKIERSFGKQINELFDSFSIEPLASASIAQVHSAILKDGSAVVVKVLRPKIKKHIVRDISLLESWAKTLEKFVKRSHKLKPYALVQEIKATLLSELDLQNEANNASKLKRFSLTIEQSYIPNIYWDYCHKNILVMEEISGVPIQDTQKLQHYGIDLSKLARTCINVFFTQIFRDRFFHADLHPGNIFIDVKNSYYPVIELVDFGITGKLDLSDQRYIAENMLAIINHDYIKVAKLHQQSGWIPDNVPVEAFARAMQKVCDPILNKSLKEISFGELLRGLIQVAKQYHIDLQPQLLLLQKTLVNIEGLCRQLDSNINIWETAKPIIEHWLKQQLGPIAFFKKLKQQLPDIIQQAPDLPSLLCNAVSTLKNIENKNNKFQKKDSADIIQDNTIHPHNRGLLFKLFLVCLLALLTFQINLHFAPLWLSNFLLGLCLLSIIIY